MRPRVISALLLIGAGVFAGATIVRDQVAGAGALAQSVFVSNTPAQAVPVRQRGIASVDVTNSRLIVAPQPATKQFNSGVGGNASNTVRKDFPAPIAASLISLTDMQGDGVVRLRRGEAPILQYTTKGGNVVLPLAQPLAVDGFTLFCLTTPCTAV